MPNLDDYLGSIVSSVTNARVMSDMQTVKIAEQYANHKLLQHFSIPRMRIDDIEMTIPIALDQSQEKSYLKSAQISKTHLKSLVYHQMLEESGLPSFPREASRMLLNEISDLIDKFEPELETNESRNFVSKFVKSITELFFDSNRKYKWNKELFKEISRLQNFADNVERVVSEEINGTTDNEALLKLNVIIDASQLREFKPETLIYIKLKITEDGMEWNHYENSKGDVESKLLPE